MFIPAHLGGPDAVPLPLEEGDRSREESVRPCDMGPRDQDAGGSRKDSSPEPVEGSARPP